MMRLIGPIAKGAAFVAFAFFSFTFNRDHLLKYTRNANQNEPLHPQPGCRTSGSNGSVGWQFVGPTTYVPQFGDDNVDHPKLPSASAVQNVVEGFNNSWFIGSVNGGVWRTAALLEGGETRWENVVDGQPVTCSSISALWASPGSQKRKTIFAGCGGSTSSEQGFDWNVMNSGDWGGIMKSTDNGDTWKMLTAFPVNYYVTDIVEFPNSGGGLVLLVSAQSHLYDRDDGGIWRSDDGGESFTGIHTQPTFTMTVLPNSLGVLATHPRSRKHSFSFYNGETFLDLGHPLPWLGIPFYTCATVFEETGRLVVAGLTRLSNAPNDTSSQMFMSGEGLDFTSKTWTEISQPTRMDEDSMPKDRMAVFADPERNDLFYVAGNAGALAWRVNVTTEVWTRLWDVPDVTDGSTPHGDCRNYAWDAVEGRLLLVSDGGIFARLGPRNSGGKWISLNGDFSGLELLSAHYDHKSDRYVAGAQDNCAIVTKPSAKDGDVAFGFVFGDGAITLVDSVATPSRLFGTTQFMGVGVIDKDRDTSLSGDGDDDDDGCGGLCFAQGDKFVQVEVDKYFPEPSSFPFFVHPYTLNRQDPTLLHIWTNGTGTGRPSAFYQFRIPYTVEDKDDIGPPTKLLETPPGVMILDFVSGGYVQGEEDPDLLLGISNTHLYIAHANGIIVEKPLPAKFAFPVTLDYDSAGARILGPLTHARTVVMTVSPSDARVIAVTGWPTIHSNEGDEVIFLTSDEGETWENVTGNLLSASGVSGKVRPGGLLLIDLLTEKSNDPLRALLVGTSNGILVTFISTKKSMWSSEGQKWIRLGSCDEFPIVLVADVEYEPISDRLVAATFGRGIYAMANAKQVLLDLFGGIETTVY